MKKMVISIIVVIISVIGFAVINQSQGEFDISLKNSTKKEISGLHLTYDNIESNVKLKSIEPGEKMKLIVNPKKDSDGDFGEDALKLVYKDSEGKSHTEYVIDYFEKGYSGEADINIKAIDENGKLEVIIESASTVY